MKRLPLAFPVSRGLTFRSVREPGRRSGCERSWARGESPGGYWTWGGPRPVPLGTGPVRGWIGVEEEVQHLGPLGYGSGGVQVQVLDVPEEGVGSQGSSRCVRVRVSSPIPRSQTTPRLNMTCTIDPTPISTYTCNFGGVTSFFDPTSLFLLSFSDSRSPTERDVTTLTVP